jgi:tRNA(Ile)-lysidine synthase
MLAALAAVSCNSVEPPFALRCLHVEHGLRPAEESRGDAAFVRELCAKLSVPCKIASVPQGKIAAFAKRSGLGIEAAARLYRRRALLREARSIKAECGRSVFILTAHTGGDLLETALMRILRGAGPAGLAAMPARRGRFLRPLLALSRADVLCYLGEKNIPWREDSTNADTRFLRNRIRHCLIPLLNESFPCWQRGLAAFAKTQSLAAAFIGDEAKRRVSWTAADGEALSADVEAFFAQPAIIREEALFRGIDLLVGAGSPAGPAAVRRAAIRRFCEGAVNAADFGTARVWRQGGRILLSAKKKRASERGFSLLIKEPGLYILNEVTIEVRPRFDSGDGTAEGFFALLPLVLRPCVKGDRIVMAGGKIEPRDFVSPQRRVLSAVDRLGTAAFIGTASMLAGRDFPGRDFPDREFPDREREIFYLVIIQRSNNNTGGTDV